MTAANNQTILQAKLDYGKSPGRKSGFYFNRFSFRLDDEFIFLYLGTVVGESTVDCNVFAISKPDLQQVYANVDTSQYIAKLGDVSRTKSKDWDLPGRYRISVANMINLSHTSSAGELTFFGFVLHETVLKMQTGKNDIESMLFETAYCDISLHRQVIGNLFHEKFITLITPK